MQIHIQIRSPPLVKLARTQYYKSPLLFILVLHNGNKIRATRYKIMIIEKDK